MKNHDPNQLDLFTNPASSSAEHGAECHQVSETAQARSTVLRFPVERWAPRLWLGKVDKIASQLQQRKTDRGRANLWRSSVEILFAQMRRRGATVAEIDHQIEDFHAAVSWALSDEQSGPGAA